MIQNENISDICNTLDQNSTIVEVVFVNQLLIIYEEA
jgi:hypothetical protein